jgi:hypothetical protein
MKIIRTEVLVLVSMKSFIFWVDYGAVGRQSGDSEVHLQGQRLGHERKQKK